MRETFTITARRACGCYLRVDQVEGAGPNVKPQRLDYEPCRLHEKFSTLAALAGATSGITVEVTRALGELRVCDDVAAART